jgi:hypothetical protein
MITNSQKQSFAKKRNEQNGSKYALDLENANAQRRNLRLQFRESQIDSCDNLTYTPDFM